MKSVKLAEDIVPIGEFKNQSAQWLDKVKAQGHTIVITQNGKPAGVLISPAEFDRIRERELFVESVQRGLADSDEGKVFSTSKVQDRLAKRRKSKAVK